MVKINENEVLLSKKDLYALIGTAAADYIGKKQMIEKARERAACGLDFAAEIYSGIVRHIWEEEKLSEYYISFLRSVMEIEEETAEAEEIKIVNGDT